MESHVEENMEQEMEATIQESGDTGKSLKTTWIRHGTWA